MDFVAVEAALIAWVAALTGIDPLLVTFEDVPRPQSNGSRALLSWVSIVGVGVDEVRARKDGSVPASSQTVHVTPVGWTDLMFMSHGVTIDGVAAIASSAATLAQACTNLADAINAMTPALVTATSTGTTVVCVSPAYVFRSYAAPVNATVADATPIANNVTPVQLGNRKLSLQIAIETFSQAPDAPHARALCEKARSRALLPGSLATLKAAKLALTGTSAVVQANYAVDGHMVARALFEARMNGTTTEVGSTADQFGTIERVRVSSQYFTDPSGAPSPTPVQITDEVMP